MARTKAAQRMAAQNVTAKPAAPLSPARAEASRKNGAPGPVGGDAARKGLGALSPTGGVTAPNPSRPGAKSKGPKAPEGEARSAQNALKHGLGAETFAVVGDEDPQEFAAFEAALMADLAPEGVLQTSLATQVVRAAWRLERADRIEAELLAHEVQDAFGDEGDLDVALLRDGNGAFDTLLRYRASAQAEFFRMLRILQELQAETAAEQAQRRQPNQPEARASESPIEPESRRKPGKPRATAAGGTDARAILLNAKRTSDTIH